ncbi:unnamed protein product [Wuchereria bancrofti]|uniref:DNA polymerase epsilon catalytic subunit n=1 Tax=Wuchereria bancrofti TaxID=6293 RepID=A0A3P7FPQ2_WUCBA|nr:unnamed protein product [Wuchereria bancrofti]
MFHSFPHILITFSLIFIAYVPDINNYHLLTNCSISVSCSEVSKFLFKGSLNCDLWEFSCWYQSDCDKTTNISISKRIHRISKRTLCSNYGSRLQKIHSAEFLDQKFGFQRYTDIEWKDAWLLNVQPVGFTQNITEHKLSLNSKSGDCKISFMDIFDKLSTKNIYIYIVLYRAEMIDEQTKNIIAVCDFYFLQEDGGRFKVIKLKYFDISYPFRPYLYIATLPSFEHQVLSYLSKKYANVITTNIVEKEDLDLKNHLSGLKRTYLKISFPSLSELLKFKKDITPILKRNQEREKQTTSYTNLLTRHFGLQEVLTDEGGVLEKIIDLRRCMAYEIY